MALTSPVVCPNKPLPRELDVVVNISRPQTELATDMTMLCVLVKNPPFPKGNGRVRFYSTFASLEEDFPMGTEGWFAGNAFFSRQVHPTTMAIGGVFTEASPAALRSGEVDLTALRAIQPGGFTAHVGETVQTVTGFSFESVTGIEALVTKLNAGMGESPIVSFAASGNDKLSVTSNNGAQVGYFTSPTSGKDVSAMLGLTEASGAMVTAGTPYHLAGGALVESAVDWGAETTHVGHFSITVGGEKKNITGLALTGVTWTAEAIATAIKPVFAAQGLGVSAVDGKLELTVADATLWGGTELAVADVATEGETGNVGAAFGLTVDGGASIVAAVAPTFTSGVVDFAALQEVASGGVSIPVNGEVIDITGLFFTPSTTIAQVAEALQGALPEGAKVTFTAEGQALVAQCTTMGDSLSFMAGPSQGVDISGLLAMTSATGAKLEEAMTEVADLVTQAGWVQQAARCTGRPIYAWALDRSYRDTEDQKAFATWCEAQTPAYFTACTNSPLAYDTSDTTNIGYYCKNNGLRRTSVFYHDNPQVYPEVSYAACALSVNYAQPDSTITLKFKTLDGIEPSPITETQLSALQSRNINCYTLIGNTSRTVREGVQSADTWFTDSLVNLDNFREELQVEVYNVFLRSPKVPYTFAGQDKLISAAKKICARYVRNGTFADREVESTTVESGFLTLPATSVTPSAIAFSTTSERAQRLAPPITITAYEAGAMHKVVINVDVYN